MLKNGCEFVTSSGNVPDKISFKHPYQYPRKSDCIYTERLLFISPQYHLQKLTENQRVQCTRLLASWYRSYKPITKVKKERAKLLTIYIVLTTSSPKTFSLVFASKHFCFMYHCELEISSQLILQLVKQHHSNLNSCGASIKFIRIQLAIQARCFVHTQSLSIIKYFLSIY